MPRDGARRDEELLRQPGDVEEEDERRLERIREEVDRGFDALRDVDDGVSVFGSARVKEGHPWYELCRETGACLTRHGYTVITGGGAGAIRRLRAARRVMGARRLGAPPKT